MFTSIPSVKRVSKQFQTWHCPRAIYAVNFIVPSAGLVPVGLPYKQFNLVETSGAVYTSFLCKSVRHEPILQSRNFLESRPVVCHLCADSRYVRFSQCRKIPHSEIPAAVLLIASLCGWCPISWAIVFKVFPHWDSTFTFWRRSTFRLVYVCVVGLPPMLSVRLAVNRFNFTQRERPYLIDLSLRTDRILSWLPQASFV